MPHLDPVQGPDLVLGQGDLDLVGREVRVELMGRAVLRLVGPEVRVGLMGRAGRVVLHPMVLRPVDLGVRVELMRRLREDRHFDSLDALRAQMQKDVDAARTWLDQARKQ